MIFIFLLLGLLVGSFLNVVVYRLRFAEELVFDRSKCPHCKKMIRWYDNIPVLSFLILKASCRDCKQKISWQYPLVELATGLLFVIIGLMHFDPFELYTWLVTLYYWGVISFFMVIFVYDLLYMEIPGPVLWLAIFWTVIGNLVFDYHQIMPLSNIFDSHIFSGTLAAVSAFLFFFFLVAISREKWMGMGDAYLAIILGYVLGWPNILLGLFLAFFIGSLYGIILILTNRKKMQSQIPFAPFLIIGSLIAIFFYQPIISWYFALFYF